MMTPACLPQHMKRDTTAIMAADALSSLTGDIVLEIVLARLEWNDDASVDAMRETSRLLDRAADQKEREK